MKRITIIIIAISTYIVALISMYFGVDKYIENKDIRLRKEIYQNLEKAFRGKDKFIDVAYSGYDVEYEKTSIPKKPTKGLTGLTDAPDFQKSLEKTQREQEKQWKTDYGDLYKIYKIKWDPNEWDNPWDKSDGWNLVEIQHDWKGLNVAWYFPYAVGYIRQNYSWGYDFAPNVQQAVNEAFDFYTKNEKSNFIADFEKGSFDRIINEIGSNEYYFLGKDEYPRVSHVGTPIIGCDFGIKKDGHYTHPTTATYMYNGYYKVFVGMSQYKTWTIRKWSYNPDKTDKEKLWKYWAIGLTIILLIIIVPLGIIESKRQKIKEETLIDRLKRLCNPANFIKNYDKEKLDIANNLYQRILSVSPDDMESVPEIMSEAITKLGIELIDKERLEELKEKVNPKNFMNPYNAKKVTLGNELYSILNKDDLSYMEMCVVETKARELYDKPE